jgi:hypothetical protein
MPLRVVWHQVVRVFRPRITRERRSKLPSLDLTGGGISPDWSYGEALALAGSHP